MVQLNPQQLKTRERGVEARGGSVRRASGCLQTVHGAARAGLPSHLTVNDVNSNDSLPVTFGEGRAFSWVSQYAHSDTLAAAQNSGIQIPTPVLSECRNGFRFLGLPTATQSCWGV